MANAQELGLGYALAKQVPDMENGFTISTDYGFIRIDAEDAIAFARLAGVLLTKKLAALTATKGADHGR